jgi:hypothetical protein
LDDGAPVVPAKPRTFGSHSSKELSAFYSNWYVDGSQARLAGFGGGETSTWPHMETAPCPT